MALLEKVLDRTREDYISAGKQRVFEALQPFLFEPDVTASRAALAQDLGLTLDAFYAAVHRLRAHYRERLRTEVAHTVSEPGEVDAELRHVLAQERRRGGVESQR